MKTPAVTKLPRIFIAAIALSGLSACATVYDDGYGYDDRYGPRSSAAAHVTYYDYRYYPGIDSYYDQRARVYYYNEHDHWVRARALPQHMRSHLGVYITMRSRYERPYEDHKHRKQHSRHHDHDRNSAPQYRDDRRDRQRDDRSSREYRDRNRAHYSDRNSAPQNQDDRADRSRGDLAWRDYQDARHAGTPPRTLANSRRVPENTPDNNRRNARAESNGRKPELGARHEEKSRHQVADRKREKQEHKRQSKQRQQPEDVAAIDDNQSHAYHGPRGTERGSFAR